jgi:predicted branched-subunit amino acid permease
VTGPERLRALPFVDRLRRLAEDVEFRRGFRDMLTFGPGLFAWGIVTGVAMTQVLGPGLSVLMSFIMFAGSAQIATLPLFASGAPMWVIWASAFCVNLRFLVFSAQWRPYLSHLPRGRRLLLSYFLADLNLVIFQKVWSDGERHPGQVPYAIGGVAAGWTTWQASSLIGIFASAWVPASWGLAFAGTLSLLGLACSLFTDRASWVAGGVAATAAVAAYALPLKLNILVAIAAAVAAALVMQRTGRAAGAREEAASP